MLNRQANRYFLILILASFIVSGLSIYFSEPVGVAGKMESDFMLEQEDANSSYQPIFKSRTITLEDICAMKDEYTELESIENHNIIVQGHGTGLSQPTMDSLSSLLGSKVITGLASPDLSLDSSFSPLSALSAFDLSTDPAFPATGNQENQGSCAAWALGYYAYGYLEAKDNGWPASEGNPAHLVSPAWIYNKINGAVDDGSSFPDVGMIIQEYGAATLATMPYDDEDLISWGDESAWREAPLHRAAELNYIDPSNWDETIEIIKILVSQENPIVFGIDAFQYPAVHDYTDFILSSVDYESVTLNHANTIVGFDDSIAKDGDIGAFRIVNSWGEAFGEGGYYWITYEAFKELFGIPELEQYPSFIEDIPDYSPSLLATWTFSKSTRRSVDINVSLGDYPTSIFEKECYFNGGTAGNYPNFMAVDISEMFADYSTLSHNFFLEALGNKGAIGSFDIEVYCDPYILLIPTRISEPISPNSFSIPGYAIVTLINVPTIPINIQATGLNRSIRLIWEPPKDNGGFQIESYTVYRLNDPQWETLAILGNQTTEYLDSPLPNGETQFYGITANNSLGESQYSQNVSTFAHTISSPPLNISGVIAGNTINLTWLPPIETGGSEISGYRIYRANETHNLTSYIENTNTRLFMENLTVPGNYTYAVSALNLAGESWLSETATLEFSDGSDDVNNGYDSDEKPTTIPWSIIIPVSLGLGSLGVLGSVGYVVMKTRRR